MWWTGGQSDARNTDRMTHTVNYKNKKIWHVKGGDFELDRQSWKLKSLAATNMIHHACYRWNEGSKKSFCLKEQNDEVSKMETQLTVLCFHDIHVNDAWWRFSCTDWGFTITMSDSRSIDRSVNRGLIGSAGHAAGREQVNCLVAMLGWRSKTDGSIPINSIPRCSAVAEGGQSKGKQKERPD